MTDDSVITPDELLKQQAELQSEAQSVLDSLELLKILSEKGRPIIEGSMALGLMTWRDIDISVMQKIAKEELNTIVNSIWTRQGILSLNLYDNTNKDRPDQPNGFYLGLKYRMASSVNIWKMDIWFIDPVDPRLDLTQDYLRSKLTQEKREIILTLKNTLAPNPKYRKVYSSRDIYLAVLEFDVTDLEGFKQYLSKTNREL